MSDVLNKFVNALHAAVVDFTPTDVADALWLATQIHIAEPTAWGRADSPPIDKTKVPPKPPKTQSTSTSSTPDEVEKPPNRTLDPDTQADLHVPVIGGNGKVEETSLRSAELRAPMPSALPAPLEIVRNLRPLMSRRPSRRQSVLDEAMTVRRIVDEGFWDLVFRPARERWLQVTLVFDTNPSTDLWRPMFRELQTMLEELGAFTRVQTWHWATDRSPPELHLPLATRPTARPAHRPLELIDPGGNQLVLVVTDCVSQSWRDGAAAAVLALWARQSQVAILHVLPWHMWPRTALRNADPVTLSSRQAVLPNVNLQVALPEDFFGESDDTLRSRSGSQSVAIPIATFDPISLNALARVAAGVGGAQIGGFRFILPLPVERPITRPSDVPVTPRAALPAPRPDPAKILARAEELVSSFWANASVPARELARYLAAAPIITLPVVRLIRHNFLRDRGRHIHEAEVILGGLLRAIAAGAGADPDQVEYVFHDGVREKLLKVLGVDDVRAVLRSISDILSRYINTELGQTLDFKALLADPAGVARGPLIPQRSRIAAVSASILRRLGGEYERLVERLSQSPADRARLAERSVVILHLSGLYFEGQRNPPVKETIATPISRIPALVRQLIDRGQKPDLVVIGGDITMDGRVDQFHMASRWIDDELLPSLSPFEPSNIIMIPGNHDVDRKAVDTHRVQSITESFALGGQRAVTDFWHSSNVEAVCRPFAMFEEFNSRYSRFRLDDPTSWGTIHETASGVRIGVARLCSSLFSSSSDGMDDTVAVVGRFPAEAALAALRRSDVRIAVMHEQPSLLLEFDREGLRQILRQNECDVVLADSNSYTFPDHSDQKGLAIIGAGNIGDPLRTDAILQVIELPADRNVARVTGFEWKPDVVDWLIRDSAPTVISLGPVSRSATAKHSSDIAPEPDWGLRRLGIPELWEQGLTGKGVLIAHLTDRPDVDHPALAGAVEVIRMEGASQSPTASPTMTPSPAADAPLGEHGTHTAGLLVGRPHHGITVGSAPDAKLLCFDIMDKDKTWWESSVILAIDLAVGRKSYVLCFAIGGADAIDDLTSVLADITKLGVLVVAAIGDRGAGKTYSPNNLPGILSVGAIDENDVIPDFSASQQFQREDEPQVPSLVAPGVNIRSCEPGGGYSRMSGTSMSACYVAGLAALLFQAKPDATAAEVRRAILDSCIRPDGMPADRANRGVPNGPRALAILRGESGLPAADRSAIKPVHETFTSTPAGIAAREEQRLGTWCAVIAFANDQPASDEEHTELLNAGFSNDPSHKNYSVVANPTTRESRDDLAEQISNRRLERRAGSAAQSSQPPPPLPNSPAPTAVIGPEASPAAPATEALLREPPFMDMFQDALIAAFSDPVQLRQLELAVYPPEPPSAEAFSESANSGETDRDGTTNLK